MNVGVDPSKVVITKLKMDKDRKARSAAHARTALALSPRLAHPSLSTPQALLAKKAKGKGGEKAAFSGAELTAMADVD